MPECMGTERKTQGTGHKTQDSGLILLNFSDLKSLILVHHSKRLTLSGINTLTTVA